MRHWIFASMLILGGANLALAGEAPAKAQACVACHGQTGVCSSP